MSANTASLILQGVASQFLESGFGSFAPAGGVPINVSGGAVNFSYTAGSGAKQFLNCYAASLSVTNGTPLVLNLNGGALTNPDGTVIALADILAILVIHKSASGNLTVGAGTDPVASIWGTGTEIILPGGFSCKGCQDASGFAVTASTAMNLQFVASAGTILFDIFILGH